MHRIDYIETFAPIVRYKLLRIFLIIATMVEIIFIQIDMIRAYLESMLGQNKYPIFMKILQEYLVGQEGLIYKILQNLYGLK